MRCTHPEAQDTAGNTTRGQGTTGGPPAVGAGQGRGHTSTEGGGREDGRRSQTPNQRGRHRLAPHTQSKPRDPRGTLGPGLGHGGTRRATAEAHAHHDAPQQPRPDSARTLSGRANTRDQREPATTPQPPGISPWQLSSARATTRAPPLLDRVLGCVCVCVRTPLVPRHSWLGSAVWM